jgi:hypothetical protein
VSAKVVLALSLRSLDHLTHDQDAAAITVRPKAARTTPELLH